MAGSMITRRKAVQAGLVAAVAFGIGGCSNQPTHSYRFKLTVEVSTPEGVRSGSSIYEVSTQNLNAILPEEADISWSTKGEAVAVELPNGQTLFALLKTYAHHGDMASLSMETLDPAFNDDVVASVERLSLPQRQGEAITVDASNYPLLIRFGDINDPTSVERVDPTNLSASFGQDYSIRSVTAELTQEPVTTRVEERLKWLGKFPEPRLDRNYRGSTNPNLSQQLSHGDFRRGV